MAIKFCTLAPIICGSSVLNLCRVTIVGLYNFEVATKFWDNLSTPAYNILNLKKIFPVYSLQTLHLPIFLQIPS